MLRPDTKALQQEAEMWIENNLVEALNKLDEHDHFLPPSPALFFPLEIDLYRAQRALLYHNDLGFFLDDVARLMKDKYPAYLSSIDSKHAETPIWSYHCKVYRDQGRLHSQCHRILEHLWHLALFAVAERRPEMELPLEHLILDRK